MFEISFGELLVIGAVALIVLGPERLPTVARTLGALVGRAQRFVASVKSDIHQQSQMAGLHELKQDIQQAADTFRHQVETEVADVNRIGREIEYDVAQVSAAAGAANVLPESEHTLSLLEAAHQPDAVQRTDENQLDLFDTAASSSSPNPRT